jgi:inositol phosphorylceramide mannosyltransferase catalytic subunit
MFGTFKELHEFLLSKNNKIIHQIWYDFGNNKKIKQINIDRQKKCQELNTDWYYMLWNNKYGDWLIDNLYPWFSFTYNSYEYPIQKVDSVRYFILYTYGGFYLDIDTARFKSMNEVRLEYPKDLYFVETGNSNQFVNLIQGHKRLCNSLIYSVRDHPFWIKVFDKMMKNNHQEWYQTKHLYIMNSTGPSLITQLFYEWYDKLDLHIFPKERFSPCCSCSEECKIDDKVMIAHYFDATWTEWDTGILNFFNCNLKSITIIIVIIISILFFI